MMVGNGMFYKRIKYLLLLIGLQLPAVSDNAKCALAGIGIAGTGVVMWRLATKHQDNDVRSKINHAIASTGTTRVFTAHSNQHDKMDDILKDLDDDPNMNERHVVLIFQSLIGQSHLTISKNAVHATIKTDCDSMNKVNTWDLWARSWLNSDLAQARNNVCNHQSDIKKIEFYATKHDDFLKCWDYANQFQSFVPQFCSPEGIRMVPILSRYNNYKLVYYNNLVHELVNKNCSIERTKYPVMAQFVSDWKNYFIYITAILVAYEDYKAELGGFMKAQEFELEQQKIKIQKQALEFQQSLAQDLRTQTSLQVKKDRIDDTKAFYGTSDDQARYLDNTRQYIILWLKAVVNFIRR